MTCEKPCDDCKCKKPCDCLDRDSDIYIEVDDGTFAPHSLHAGLKEDN